jgi:hypothetical protein
MVCVSVYLRDVQESLLGSGHHDTHTLHIGNRSALGAIAVRYIADMGVIVDARQPSSTESVAVYRSCLGLLWHRSYVPLKNFLCLWCCVLIFAHGLGEDNIVLMIML